MTCWDPAMLDAHVVAVLCYYLARRAETHESVFFEHQILGVAVSTYAYTTVCFDRGSQLTARDMSRPTLPILRVAA